MSEVMIMICNLAIDSRASFRLRNRMSTLMKILLASSEVHPFSKTGGLADMVGALGKALARAGHEARIVTPLYRGIREKFPEMQRVDWQFDLPLGARRVQAELWSLEIGKRADGLFH